MRRRETYLRPVQGLASQSIVSILKECKNEVLIDLLDAKKEYLPLWVVLRSPFPQFTMMYFIGQVNGIDLFYGGTFYKRINPQNILPARVKEVNKLKDLQ